MRGLATGHTSMYPTFDLCHNSPGYRKNLLEKGGGRNFGLCSSSSPSFSEILQNVMEKKQFHFHDTARCVVKPHLDSAKMLHFTKKKNNNLADCVDNTLSLVLPICTCAAHASPLPLIQLVQSLGPEICQCWTNYFLMVTHRNLGYATTNLMQDI